MRMWVFLGWCFFVVLGCFLFSFWCAGSGVCSVVSDGCFCDGVGCDGGYPWAWVGRWCFGQSGVAADAFIGCGKLGEGTRRFG